MVRRKNTRRFDPRYFMDEKMEEVPQKVLLPEAAVTPGFITAIETWWNLPILNVLNNCQSCVDNDWVGTAQKILSDLHQLILVMD